MEISKEQFLKEFGEDYGYPDGPKNIDEIRDTEFKRLANGPVYLDHAGATLYSELQMEAIFKDLTSNVYGNPHSQSDSSMDTSDIISECRQLVLDYCNASAKDYKCIFTSGATAALKMVGEAFPWCIHSHFMYTMENHNSVIGIREYALNHGAAAVAIDVEELVDQDTSSLDKRTLFEVSKHAVQRRSDNSNMKEDDVGNACHLFALPSECNFSGARFNLDIVRSVKEHSEDIFKDNIPTRGRWFVLIDAAKGCATEPPDLSKYPADFVVLSFYKIFGYPTGLGALVVRNEAAKLLKKTYFGGGTVAASIADMDFVKHRSRFEESFEDGTASFLSIASIRHGFRIVNSHTISSISRHTSSLTIYTRRVLSSLKHDNGAHACIIYGDLKVSVTKGSVVSFNLKRPDSSWVGYREVEKLASLCGIQLRTGCFCNPGACAKYLGLSHLELISNVEAGHVCWDDLDVVNGKPTGAVRVSFGYMSTYEEAKKLIDFIVSSFVALPTPMNYKCLLSDSDIILNEGPERIHRTTSLCLKSITVYPIKSCTGFCVDSWPISKTGLIHDREWLLRSPSGEILTQKKVPEMSLISTFIDLNQGILFVESPRCATKLQILLKSTSNLCGSEEIDLHGHRYEVHCYNQEVNSWFSSAIKRPCILWRYSASDCHLNKRESAGMCRDMESPLSFVNEAQFLLISETSVTDLNNRLQSKTSQDLQAPVIQVSATRFRPNLVISGGEPYAEDLWAGVQIGSKYFSSLGGCNRCQMINFDHESDHVHKSSEPLATLASYRRVKGRILFGILLRIENCSLESKEVDSWLVVGEEVYPYMR